MSELDKLHAWLDANFQDVQLKEVVSRKLLPDLFEMNSAHKAIEAFKQTRPIEIVRWALIGRDTLAYQDLVPDFTDYTDDIGYREGDEDEYGSVTKSDNEWYIVNGGWVGYREEGSDILHCKESDINDSFKEIPVDEAMEIQRAYLNVPFERKDIVRFCQGVVSHLDDSSMAPR